jgi:hypothetical protein
VSKNRQSNKRRTKEAVAIVVSRLCLGSSEMADCDRRDSAYCNKRYGRPATRCSLVVGMVVESVGAHAINRRARRNESCTTMRWCCRVDIVVAAPWSEKRTTCARWTRGILGARLQRWVRRWDRE